MDYSEGTDGLLRPYLWLDVEGRKGQGRTMHGLVDSGADWSALPKKAEAFFGYTEEDLVREEDAHQINGTVEVWRLREPLRAKVTGLERSFELRPRFIKGSKRIVWGRGDFMAAYAIKFLEADRRFSLLLDLDLDFTA